MGEDPDALDADPDANGHLGKGDALHPASFLGCLGPGGDGGAVKREDEGHGGGTLHAGLERGTRKGATALICATSAGQAAAVLLLLNCWQQRSWRRSCSRQGGGHTATVELLLDRGARRSCGQLRCDGAHVGGT